MRQPISPRQIALLVVFLILAGMALAMSATAINACPDCPASRSARASALGSGFWTNLGMISLPLVVLIGICALLYRVGTSHREGDASP
jgi:uncharacterized BrkB/YihY/UPF0761 family membrane protein